MATFNGAPMDEIQWRLEAAVAHFGGIRAENIHLYFLASPFCDSASNNKALENQLRFQPDSFQTLQDRTAFEDALRRMNSGVEYIITDGPRKTTPDMNPVWVIRKQRRTKGMRSTDPREAPPPDRIDVLGTYYAVGENIYQAPSIIDILSNRLLTIEDNMQKIYSTAASMQYFSPAQGHRYVLDTPSTATKDNQSTRGSRMNTPAPDEIHIPTPKHSQQSVGKNADDFNARENNALLRSLNMSVRYGSEFIDTNPLLGEPGSLVFTSTESHLQAQAAAKAKATADKLAKEAKSTTSSSMPSPMMDSKHFTAKKGSKAEKTIIGGGKFKRRKSRITGSPEDD